ncbi:energy transducer TonB [Flavobacterium flavigenum]|uniref:energy transducer TonB n=1 Tax=Flavobacterium flavigenum TaxID=3003258 RepID=UPI002482B331|nr:energy transducer TonB [Flavobacterium flavigenum]
MQKFLILILICFSQNIFSQKEIKRTLEHQKNKNGNIVPLNENTIYNLIDLDVKPEFPGGRVKFNHFIDDNYKKSNKRPTIQGKLFATFIIEKDGVLSNIKVLRDIGYGTGEELIRVLKSSPRWKPGKQNDKEVRSIYSIVVPVQQ